MLSEDMNAETAAFEVGHESPQFSREHTRMFRVPPRRDIVAVQFDSGNFLYLYDSARSSSQST
jgi:hypothetical protein